MKYVLKPDIYLAEKGSGRVALVDLVDDSDAYLMVDGDLAEILKATCVENKSPEEILKKYSPEDQKLIQEFFKDLVEAGFLIKE